MALEKVDLHEVRETLLITLYARALDRRRATPILGDRWAGELVGRIDYDFARLRLTSGDAVAIAARAKQFDLWAQAFLRRHPDAVVLHLGCGLDSRAFRVDPPPGAAWFDVDLPDVIALRRKLYPPRAGYRLIGATATEPRWIDDIPPARPALIVAEGLLMYLLPAEVHSLLDRATGHFPAGELAFDVLSARARRLAALKPALRVTGARFTWVVDDPGMIARRHPRLRLLNDVPLLASPLLAQAPFGVRLFCRVMAAFPGLRNMHRLLRFGF